MSEAGVYLTYEERSCQRQEFISHMRGVHVRGRIFGRRRFPDEGAQFVLDDVVFLTKASSLFWTTTSESYNKNPLLTMSRGPHEINSNLSGFLANNF